MDPLHCYACLGCIGVPSSLPNNREYSTPPKSVPTCCSDNVVLYHYNNSCLTGDRDSIELADTCLLNAHSVYARANGNGDKPDFGR